MERMQKEAEAIGDGVLGIVEVKLNENSHGWGSHVIEFFALGTAVVPNEHAEDGQQFRTSHRCLTSTTDLRWRRSQSPAPLAHWSCPGRSGLGSAKNEYERATTGEEVRDVSTIWQQAGESGAGSRGERRVERLTALSVRELAAAILPAGALTESTAPRAAASAPSRS